MRAVSLFGLLAAAVLAAAGCTNSPASPPAARPATALKNSGTAALRAALNQRGHADPYYLSLGDSLAQGIQPGPSGGDGPTSDGYPDVLASRLRATFPSLRLVKLGCSGETTTTMIKGGICPYHAGSQLAQATRFLRSHRGQVALVTIDIGANDPNSCILGQPVSHMFGCLNSRVTEVQRNVDDIMARIRSAAGQKVLVIGMTYYVPELALWRNGQDGKQLALLTEGFAAGVNQLLVKRYHHYNARVANVFAAFNSGDFGRARTRASSTRLPPNVQEICALTWMCAPAPRGPNEHANSRGYRVIAAAFWRAITR